MDPALLRQPRLSLLAHGVDGLIQSIRDVISQPVMVEGRADVEDVLGRLACANVGPAIPRTLDLIGHSTPDRSLLVLGDWVIDGTSSKVLSFFRGLADCEALARLGVRAVRLLGCETAMSEGGRHTLMALSEILELEVFGTSQMIDAGSYDAGGFRTDREHLLVSATEVGRQPMLTLVKRGGEPYRRVLDIDTLPSSPLGPSPTHPRRIADLSAARRLLALVRRTDGAQMAGPLAAPSCEIALPTTKPGWFHRVQLLMDGAFARVYPDGEDRPGVVFPVNDPAALRAILLELPTG
jgi:hypothetical protein